MNGRAAFLLLLALVLGGVPEKVVFMAVVIGVLEKVELRLMFVRVPAPFHRGTVITHAITIRASRMQDRPESELIGAGRPSTTARSESLILVAIRNEVRLKNRNFFLRLRRSQVVQRD